MAEALSSIYRLEGGRGLMTGLGATLARDVPFSAVYYAVYTQLKQLQPGVSSINVQSTKPRENQFYLFFFFAYLRFFFFFSIPSSGLLVDHGQELQLWTCGGHRRLRGYSSGRRRQDFYAAFPVTLSAPHTGSCPLCLPPPGS